MKVRLDHFHIKDVGLGQLTALLLVFAIVSFNVGQMHGLHLHVLENGRVIVHSHPVNDGDRHGDRHAHSTHSYTVIGAVGKILLTDCPDRAFEARVPGGTVAVAEQFRFYPYSRIVIIARDKRGPPDLFSLS